MEKNNNYGILVSFKHIGDLNQAKYTKICYQKRLDNFFNIQLLNVEGEDQFEFERFNYLHSVGQKGLIYVLQLNKEQSLKNHKIVVQIHQHFPQIYDIQPDFLIIPKNTFKDNECLNKTNKFLLNGVLFQKYTKEELKIIYQDSSISKIVTTDDQYITIMLSGDAPDQNGMRFFDEKSADILFYRLVYLLGRFSTLQIKPKIIVQNGPRTGKHDINTGKQKCNHTYKKNQEDPTIAEDQISKYFVKKLTDANLEYLFFNFSFQITQQGRKVNSFYKPLLYIAMMKQNYFMFPMQSVSMCSQLPFYIQGSRLISYHSSSTNDFHMKIVNQGFQKGLYHKFDGPGIGKLSFNQKKKQERYDQIEKILDQIISAAREDQVKVKDLSPN